MASLHGPWSAVILLACYGGSVVGKQPGSLFEKLRALRLPASEYAIFGSGPLVAHGLLGEVRDIDLVARGAAWRRAAELGLTQLGTEGDPVVRLEDGRIEVFGGWMGWDIGALIDGAQRIDGLPFARLEDVLAWKRAYARPSDLEHARLIGRHLRGDSTQG